VLKKELSCLKSLVGCHKYEKTTNINFLIFSQIIFAQTNNNLPSKGVSSVGLAFPNTQISFFLGKVYAKSPGWFCEIRTGFGPSEDDIYDRSVKWAEETLGDSKVDESTAFASYSGGLTFGINTTTSIYIGGGITKVMNYNQYYDPFEILGNDGKYWIEDDSENSIEPNLTAGIMLHNKKFGSYFVTYALSLNMLPFNFQLSTFCRHSIPLVANSFRWQPNPHRTA